MSGEVIAEYCYDAWGNLISILDANGNPLTSGANYNIATTNPFRYRGYYYDVESGFYYLNSRYYDPQVGRFINADGIIVANGDLVGYNMFAYCSNNPVVFADHSGYAQVHTMLSDGGYYTGELKWNVPLYKQGKLSLCWAFCETMIESYKSKIKLSQKQAKERAIEIAKKKQGSANKEDWNQGLTPEKIGTLYGRVTTIKQLYDILAENGPVYAYYFDSVEAHIVVVTGVSVKDNVVYTNNPWGIQGKQSFKEFQNGCAVKWYQDGKFESGALIYLINK